MHGGGVWCRIGHFDETFWLISRRVWVGFAAPGEIVSRAGFFWLSDSFTTR